MVMVELGGGSCGVMEYLRLGFRSFEAGVGRNGEGDRVWGLRVNMAGTRNEATIRLTFYCNADFPMMKLFTPFNTWRSTQQLR